MESVAPNYVYPSREDRSNSGGNYVGTTVFCNALAQGTIDPTQTPYIFGHFPAWIVDDLKGDWRHATILREPIARTVSMLGHHNAKQATKHSDLRNLLRNEGFRKNNIENYQTKLFGASEGQIVSANDPLEVNEDLFERAIERIGKFHFVGLTDNINATVDGWHDLVDLPKAEFPHFNKAKPREISAELREAILPYVQYDLRFYEAVKSTLKLT